MISMAAMVGLVLDCFFMMISRLSPIFWNKCYKNFLPSSLTLSALYYKHVTIVIYSHSH
jgi:hypothetical protein